MSPVLNRLRYHLYRGLWTGLDWIYPPYCGGCHKPGDRWCSDCQKNVEKLETKFCQRCGDIYEGDAICLKCQVSLPMYQALRSWGKFSGPLREAIHRLKYKNDIGMGEALSINLIELFYRLKWPVNLIVPVPLGVKRQHERGYNQSTLLARPIALSAGLQLRTNALLRARETATQVGLSASERKVNVRGAFLARRDLVKGKNILVVDDVTTTGSTIEACSEALISAGANQVFGLTLARSVFGMDDVSQSQVGSQIAAT
jgi:competence protein ComFC